MNVGTPSVHRLRLGLLNLLVSSCVDCFREPHLLTFHAFHQLPLEFASSTSLS